MKGLIVVVLLVLNISTLDALTCNTCVTINGVCTPEAEGCEDTHDVCGTVTMSYPVNSVSKGCMRAVEVAELSASDHVSVVTCSTDLCN